VWKGKLKGKNKRKTAKGMTFMKKATKPATAKKPAQQRPVATTKSSSAKPRPRAAQGQAQIVLILERLAKSAERLAQAAERLAQAAVRTPAIVGSEAEPKRQDQEAGNVVGVVVVDEGEGEE
jgi:hypothetical protein